MKDKEKDKPPSIQEWKDLYNAAMEFKRIECWNWMRDSDLFGVQNPVNGEIGYCCIMGMLGRHFALAVYQGTEGLEGYLKIQSGEVDLHPAEALHLQKCLSVSFENRKFLNKKDLQLIKALNLKFRGHDSWPLFRSYLPGYLPWYLTQKEAKYLTLCLWQTIDVALRFKDDRAMLYAPMKNRYLVRVPIKNGLKWKGEWLEPSKRKKEEIIAEPDVNRLEELEKMKRRGVWEIDFVYSPYGIREKGERPYYPYIILWVDHRSGLILHHHIVKSTEFAFEFPEQNLKFVKKFGSLPREILVKREEIFRLLKPVAFKLEIELSKNKKLTMVKRVVEDMFESSSGER